MLCYYFSLLTIQWRTAKQQRVYWVVDKPKPWDWKFTNWREI